MSKALQNITPRLSRKDPAVVEVHHHGELVFICREMDGGRYFNINRLFQYNIHISAEGIKAIEKSYKKISSSLAHMSVIDKMAIIHLHQSNVLDYYTQCAAKVMGDYEVIKDRLQKGRAFISEEYSALNKSGFKYVVANYLPYKDDLIALYSIR